MKLTYSEKLKDPRWQRKRLEIFQRDEWKCLGCGTADTTLHVHHLKYSGEPWDVENEFLETLCEKCHDVRENGNYIGKQFRELPSSQVIQCISAILEICERNEGKFGDALVDIVHEKYGGVHVR